MAENNSATTSEGLSWYKDPMFMAGVDYSMAGFSQLASGYLAYGAQKTTASSYGVKAGSLETQADSVELAAKEAGNQLRQKYLAMAGNLEYSAAARGVSVESGSIHQNLERSSEKLGKDISKIESNAELKSKSLRAEAGVARGYEKAYSKTAGLMQVGGILSGVGNAALGAGLMFGNSGGAK